MILVYATTPTYPDKESKKLVERTMSVQRQTRRTTALVVSHSERAQNCPTVNDGRNQLYQHRPDRSSCFPL